MRDLGGCHETNFDAFYEQTLPGAMRLGHLLTGSVSLGQEVAQDAMIAVHRHWSEIENPAAYLRTTVVNLSRSAQRRLIRERRHLRRHSETLTMIPDVDETWEQLRRLPVAQRTVLVLRFYEDMSLAEIADHLGKPVGTVKSTMHRALAKLKDVLP